MKLPALLQMVLPVIGYFLAYGFTTLMVGTAYGQNRRPARIAGWFGVAVGCAIIWPIP